MRVKGTIEDQIRIEKDMVSRGVARYRASVSTAEEAGRAGDTMYAQKIFSSYLQAVSEGIALILSKKPHAGFQSKYRGHLREANHETLAYIALRSMIEGVHVHDTFTALAFHIGCRVEDEIRFSTFAEVNPGYYETLISDYRKRGTVAYKHIRTGLSVTSRKTGFEWRDWPHDERIGVGALLIDVVCNTTPLFEIGVVRSGKTATRVVHTTPVFSEWTTRFHSFAQMLSPDRCPCVIEPLAWTSLTTGGYFTEQLQRRTPLVDARWPEHRDLLNNAQMPKVYAAVNYLQTVPWQINRRVLETMQQVWDAGLEIGLPSSQPIVIPPSPLPEAMKKADMTPEQIEMLNEWKAEARVLHTAERERVSKCFQAAQALRMAAEYNNFDRLWFVYHCDFRGRIYAHSSGVSPQGADFSRALLMFADGKPLGERGAYWLAVHGANTFGKDKLPYSQRVQWVADNVDMIRAVAADPIGNKSAWRDADKPWQFLAFCFEYSEYLDTGYDYVSHLSIGLDGSCNGLQHFSAMLRDKVGGAATNLLPGDKPADIYSEVGAVCAARIMSDQNERARTWQAYIQTTGGLPRGIPKKPVMTLPYGSTQRSAFDSTYNFLTTNAPEFFPREIRSKEVAYITPVLWDSIGHVVIAARAAMSWLQSAARDVTRAGAPLYWIAPTGFPVYQKRVKKKRVRIELAVSTQKRFEVTISNDTDTLDLIRQKQGLSPNFVHSMDASHLVFTLCSAKAAGISAMHVVHDDYGTHAADTDKLHEIIRTEFCEIYVNHDPLNDFKKLQEERLGIQLADLPPQGELKITDVFRSPYFFG